jgi:subtilisin family serine protease
LRIKMIKQITKLKLLAVISLVAVAVLFVGRNLADQTAKNPVVLIQHSPKTVGSKTSSETSKKQNGGNSILSSKYRLSKKQAEIKSRVAVEKRYYLLSDPNDSLYSSDWALHAVGASTAWNYSADSSNVKVAVLDSGFALSHQDLSDRWYTNFGEVGDGKETNGIDDDGNGYIDDWRGWDFYNTDNNPQTGLTDPQGDGVQHGTEVAGLVGATTDNSLGVASIARNPTIMPLQVMSDGGSGYSSDIAAALYYATDQGANVINMSLGTSGDDPAVRDAVDYAISHNVVVVAAAGNCGDNFNGVCANQPAGMVTFPASYDKVVAVGAVNESNQRASFSSYGQRVDIMAPGSGSIYSTSWDPDHPADNNYYATSLYGTSFSSPITASAAALIRSIRPNTSVDDVRALLMASAKKVSAMSGNTYTNNYGHGLLDVGKSLEVANDLNGITEQNPLVFQAGNYKADSQYRSSDLLGSGCEVAAGTWCTVWLRNTTQNYDRFLPYSKTDVNNEYGWSWSGSILQNGEWQIRARQGDHLSAETKVLSSK